MKLTALIHAKDIEPGEYFAYQSPAWDDPERKWYIMMDWDPLTWYPRENPAQRGTLVYALCLANGQVTPFFHHQLCEIEVDL